MAICEFCGKEIPEGEICECTENAEIGLSEPTDVTEIISDEETVIGDVTETDENTEEETVSDETADEESTDEVQTDETDDDETAEDDTENAENTEYAEPVVQEYYQPKPQLSAEARRRRIARRKVKARRRRIAALIIIILFFWCISFIRNHTGVRGTVHKYWKCVVSEDGGEDYYTLGLPKYLIRHFEDTGEWTNLIENYENLSADAVKLKKISKIKRMSKDELRDAEKYLYGLIRRYGAEAPDGTIIADKGYLVTVIYIYGGEKTLGGAYYVKIQGEGWKVLPYNRN